MSKSNIQRFESRKQATPAKRIAPDDPSRYEGHDESRENGFDPKVTEGIGMKILYGKNKKAGH